MSAADDGAREALARRLRIYTGDHTSYIGVVIEALVAEGWRPLADQPDTAAERQVAAVRAELDRCEALAERVHESGDAHLASAYGRIVQAIRAALATEARP